MGTIIAVSVLVDEWGIFFPASLMFAINYMNFMIGMSLLSHSLPQVIPYVVLTILLMKIPGLLKYRNLRKVWIAIFMFEVGSLIIQYNNEIWVDVRVHIPEIGLLLSGVWGICNTTILLHLFLYFIAPWNPLSRFLQQIWLGFSVITVTIMVATFFLKPAGETYIQPQPHSIFMVVYVWTACVYTIASSLYIVRLALRLVRCIDNKLVQCGFIIIACGVFADVPFIVWRLCSRMNWHILDAWSGVIWGYEYARFILVPLGLSIILIVENLKNCMCYILKVLLSCTWGTVHYRKEMDRKRVDAVQKTCAKALHVFHNQVLLQAEIINSKDIMLAIVEQRGSESSYGYALEAMEAKNSAVSVENSLKVLLSQYQQARFLGAFLAASLLFPGQQYYVPEQKIIQSMSGKHKNPTQEGWYMLQVYIFLKIYKYRLSKTPLAHLEYS